MEGGIWYRLELHSNGAGGYILYSACYVKARWFTLVFPEGRGVSKGLGSFYQQVKRFPGGWMILPTSVEALGWFLFLQEVRRPFQRF